jgi:hypothetical protein
VPARALEGLQRAEAAATLFENLLQGN